MRLRAVHFACVILLLSTFGAADLSALQNGSGELRSQYVGMLLQHGVAAVATEPAFPTGTADALRASLPVELLVQSRTVWTMRAPSAQSVTMHTVTGLGR